MKRIVSLVLVLSIILSLTYTVPVYADNVDATIQARIDELYNLLGNTYFTTDQQSAGSSSSRCLNSNVIKADWFIEKFGLSNLSVSQFPGSPRCTAEAWSCSGFASFAGWYIFKNSDTDNVRINKLDKMNYTYDNVIANAKIGDIISLSGTKYDTNGVAVGSAGHEFIFISADSNGAYVLDSNWGNSCKVTKHYIRYSYCDYFQIGRATNRSSVGVTDNEAPTISNLSVSDISGSSFTIKCDLNDNVGVTRVWLNVYGPGGSNGYEVSASNGSFSHTINTSDYGGEGYYSVHVYAFDAAGNEQYSNMSDINAYTDSEAPTISNLSVSDISGSSFTIKCDLNDNVGVTRVWLNVYGPSGSNGYEVSASNGSFSHTINTADYGGAGTYEVHVYAFDGKDNSFYASLTNIGAWVNLGDNFYAYITNTKSGLYVVQNENKNAVIQSYSNSSSHVWKFIRQDDGGYKIISTKNNLCLDVLGSGTESGTNVRLWEDNGMQAQRWYISGEENDYVLKPGCSDCVLDVAGADYQDGTNLHIWLNANHHAQKFSIIEIEDISQWNVSLDLGDRFYAHITNTESGLYIVQNKNSNAVIQSYVNSSSHVWEFIKQDDGGYKIVSTKNGLCLDVFGSNTEKGTNVRLWKDNGLPAQRWYFFGSPNNYVIKSGCGECVLDVAGADYQDGTNIQMWENNGHHAQKFSVIKIEDISKFNVSLDLGDDFYAYITNTKSNFNIAQNKNNNAILQNFTNSNNQIWHFIKQDDGGYKIVSTKNGLCLSVYESNTEKGTNVQFSDDNGLPSQRWYFSGSPNNYVIKSGCSECVLEVAGADYQDGTNIQMWENNGYHAQKFSIVLMNEKLILSNVESGDGSISIETTIYNISLQSQIVVVGYQNNKCIEIQKRDYSGKTESFLISNNIDKIKVMLWDSLSGLKPLCSSEVIPSSEWTIE